ncbi:siphovirus ReqiPepy6 Gp37-like family protein [Kitasatospora purpeofusca]|uniref:hypothetical protein n=1 Tax=Kitasatospora purpeofusca TaxID=67352 RepID=UPI00224D0DE4|nr:hypothetical protein [Kitasatospora purpeofusca]MCX4687222.1 siphovirus ReqiPepy6 Gp37-like family protein [Kitasatospora purpeofusca]
MPADYRVIFVEFVSGDIWGELPFSDLSYSLEINAPGSASLKIPLWAFDWQALQPWRVLVYIQRGEQILWGGPLLAFAVDLEAEDVTLSAIGLWGYYRRRVIGVSVSYVQMDQGAITKALVSTFGDGTAGPQGLTWDSSAETGVIRDRTYARYEYKALGQAVEDLAGVRDGFDFGIYHTWSGSRVLNRFRFSAQAGIPTDVVLEHGANCDIPSFTVDGTARTTEAIVTGGGEGDDQLTAVWVDLPAETSPSRRIPRLTSVQSRQDVTTMATLTGYSQQAISEGSTPVVLPAVRLYPDAYPGPGDLQPGHLVRVRARVGGRLVLDGAYKVTAVSVRLTDGGEECTVTLVPEGVFASVGSASTP